ncbi:MAG: RluA family pseudouridine synthase, partial [Clostridia bacterium]|nr:RluA family pseudouridine synthase [Clostridia bacterium]
GNSAKANQKLKIKDKVTVLLRPAAEVDIAPENIPIDIVYEDADIAVIDKPKGMVVHPAPGNPNGTLVNALMYHLSGLSGIGGELRPGIVHRIDKLTSGLIVVAKNDMAHTSLAAQLKEHSARRTYIAIVDGNIKEDSGTVDAPIGRHPVDRKRMAVVKDGREAVTHWRVLERYGAYTLIEARLETGRTHQIRVHMAHIKHPVAGDVVYGSAKPRLGLDGQALHAARLELTHPATGERMTFKAKVPEYFASALKKAGRNEAEDIESALKSAFGEQ